MAKVKQAVKARLEVAENRLVIFACTVLNTEGWERMYEEGEKDLLFADDCVTELYSHFQEPLSNAGLDGSLSDLLEQWHSVIEYTTRYLSPSTTPYLRVDGYLIQVGAKVRACMVLLLAELLFSIPISNAKVERLFSLMNRIKTDSRATLGESTLNSLVRISMECPKFEEYDPTSAIHLWADIATRRPRQKRRKKYKRKDSSKKRRVLIDDSSMEESAESEEDEESS